MNTLKEKRVVSGKFLLLSPILLPIAIFFFMWRPWILLVGYIERDHILGVPIFKPAPSPTELRASKPPT